VDNKEIKILTLGEAAERLKRRVPGEGSDAGPGSWIKTRQR